MSRNVASRLLTSWNTITLQMAPKGSRLNSWKEIADHLGRSVRTVQRWQAEEGLPVYRIRHKQRSSAYAYSSELDEWLSSKVLSQLPADSPEPPEDVEQEMKEEQNLSEPVSVNPVSPGGKTFWLGLRSLATVLTLGALVFVALKWTREPSPTGVVHGRIFARSMSEEASVRWIELPFRVEFLRMDSDEEYIYAVGGGGRIAALDRRRQSIVWERKSDPRVQSVVLGPDGGSLYLAHPSGIDIVDTKGAHTISRISLPARVSGMEFNEDGSELFVAMPDFGLGTLHIPSGRFKRVSSILCPQVLRLARSRNHLYVGYRCGGPSGWPGHDSIEILDASSYRPVGLIAGPPMVGGSMVLLPDDSHTWVIGADACLNPRYDRSGCPSTTGVVGHVFRNGDLRLMKSLVFTKNPIGLDTPPDSSRVTLTSREEGIKVMSARSYAVLERVPWLGAATLSYSTKNYLVFATAEGRNGIAVLDTSPGLDPPTQALAHHWPGDGSPDNARTTWHAEAKNGAGYASGIVGQAFVLSGAGQSFAAEGGRFGGTFSTISLWIKMTTIAENMPVITRFERDRKLGWGLKVAGGRPVFEMVDGRANRQITGLGRLTPGEWTHVAVTCASDTAQLYINGKVQASLSGCQWPESGAPLRIGAGEASQEGYFHGKIDEVALYDRVIPEEEIRQMIRAIRPSLVDQRSAGKRADVSLISFSAAPVP